MPKARRVRPQKVANAVKNVVRQETKRKRRRGPSTRGRRPRRFNRRNLKKGERVLTAPYTTTVSWGGTKFMPYVRNGNIGIRASELLTNLTVPAGGYASSNVIYSTVLNPRSFGSGKLRNFAANYDQFKFRNVTVEFVPATGTTTPGRINMSYDRDPLDHRSGISGDALDRVSGSDQLMRSNPVWEKFSLTANDKWINSSRLFYFNDPVNDPRMWSQGTFYIQNMGPLFSGSTEPTQLGTLYVHYDVQFKDFQLSSISTGNSFYSTSTTPTDGSWFAGSTFNQYNNLDLQIVHSTVGADHDEIYFPERGTYYINTWGWWGDPIHTDMQIAFPAVAGGNMVRFIQTNIEDAAEKFPIETSAPGVGLWFLKVTVVSPNIPLILTQLTGNAPLNNAFFCFLGNEPVPIDILPSGGDPGLRKLVDNLSQRIRQLEITPKPDNCSFNVHTGQILQHNKLEANVVGNVTAEVSNTPAVTISGQPIGVVVEAEKAKRKFKRKQFKMQMEEYFKNAFKQFPNYSDTESVSVISDEDDDEKDV